VTAPDATVAQLRDELGTVAFGLAGLLGTDILPILNDRITVAAERLYADLDCGDAPSTTGVDILTVLWPHCDPDLDWWRTPLGLAVAPLLAATVDADEGWSHADAATVLGVTRGTVAQLVHRGQLDRTPDGSLSRPSVLTRLVRLARRGA